MLVDTQNLLLPGVVAVVVALSVIYLIYRLFASSSPPKKTGSNKQDRPKKPQQQTPKAKKKATPSENLQPHRKLKNAAQVEEQESADEEEQPIEPPKNRKAQKKRKENSHEEENISDFLPIIGVKEGKGKGDKALEAAKPKVTGKDKIAAAKEEPLAEGWEIVGLRKKERKEEKRKEKEQEKLKEEEKKSEENGKADKKEGKKFGKKSGDNRERREGAREGRERGPRGNRPGDRKNPKDQEKKETVTASPQVTEKTKRREEITINGISFSKFKDDEEEDEDWELLSEIIENGSSDSDDITPLRTAHLELRYFTLAKDASSGVKKRFSLSAESKPQSEAAWGSTAGELAKYNYTQGRVEELDKEKEEGAAAEVQSSRAWDLGEEHVPDEKTAELIEAYIKALGHPFTSNLSPAKLSVKGKPQRFLIRTDVDSLRARLLKLLSSGVSLEPPVCRSQSEAAEFVEKLLGYLDAPFVCYTNEFQSSDGTYSRGAKFWRKGFGDAGFFVISATKVVMIWFIGYD